MSLIGCCHCRIYLGNLAISLYIEAEWGLERGEGGGGGDRVRDMFPS